MQVKLTYKLKKIYKKRCLVIPTKQRQSVNFNYELKKSKERKANYNSKI